VPDVVVVEEADKTVVETKDENYDQCGHHREEIDELLIPINEIKQKQDEDRQINESKAAKTDAEMKSLVEQNKKIAAEIKSLNTINEELRNDNAIIRCAFEIKQGE
jgi:protein subunit release factor A